MPTVGPTVTVTQLWPQRGCCHVLLWPGDDVGEWLPYDDIADPLTQIQPGRQVRLTPECRQRRCLDG